MYMGSETVHSTHRVPEKSVVTSVCHHLTSWSKKIVKTTKIGVATTSIIILALQVILSM